MGDGEPLIEARGLTKRFGPFVAVDGIDFRVERGEAFGFLGPNGAGKTSTMRMIGCTSPITEGELRVLGLDPARTAQRSAGGSASSPRRTTSTPSSPSATTCSSTGATSTCPARVIRERAEELLEFVQLADRADSLVDPLSGGMKRRLTIARSLISSPELLLLDEPTTGLDPQARHLVWDRLYQLKRQGVSFVLTTHYMDEAEQLCDRLVIMDGGRIVAEGSPRELIERHATREVVELRFPEDDQRHEALVTAGAHGDRAEAVGDRVIVYTRDGDAAAERLTGNGLRPEATMVRRATLEDVFLLLTGHALEE